MQTELRSAADFIAILLREDLRRVCLDKLCAYTQKYRYISGSPLLPLRFVSLYLHLHAEACYRDARPAEKP